MRAQMRGTGRGLTEVKEDSQAVRQRASQRQERNGGEQRQQERDNGKRAWGGGSHKEKQEGGTQETQTHRTHTQVDKT